MKKQGRHTEQQNQYVIIWAIIATCDNIKGTEIKFISHFNKCELKTCFSQEKYIQVGS